MATLKDIATEAGVSVVTVSNVLRGRYKESWPSASRRADEIRDIAQRLGYRPHAGAIATVTGRFGCATLLLGTQEVQSNLPQQMLRGIHEELALSDMHLMLACLPDEKLSDEKFVPKILRQWMSDGLLIDYTHGIPERMMDIIRSNRLPAVWINSKQELDSVYPDDFGASREATRLLLEMNHHRIAFVDFTPRPPGTAEHYSHADRRDGYESVMVAAGLESEIVNEPFLPRSERVARMLQLLSQSQPPSAVIAYGSEVEDLLFAAQRLNIAVPDQLSVITFGDAEFYCNGHRLTQMLVPQRQIGIASVQALMQKIQQPDHAIVAITLRFELDVGDTVRKFLSGPGSVKRAKAPRK